MHSTKPSAPESSAVTWALLAYLLINVILPCGSTVLPVALLIGFLSYSKFHLSDFPLKIQFRHLLTEEGSHKVSFSAGFSAYMLSLELTTFGFISQSHLLLTEFTDMWSKFSNPPYLIWKMQLIIVIPHKML